jgi:hypothetical protein
MSADKSSNQTGFFPRDFVIVLSAVLVVSLAPSFQSFWIDEGTIGVLSRSATFAELHTALSYMKGSETLMPLTTTYFWALEKIVGDGEWALRCGNLPWLWLGIGCLALAGKRIGWPWLPLLFAIHPVVWFYADEVRPYAIQLGVGSWMALGFLQIVQSDGKNNIGLWNVGLASAATTLASFLGIFVIVAVGIVLLILAVARRWKITSRQCGILGFLAIINLAILLPMLSRLGSGAGGSKVWTVGVANIGFVFYELLGFAGLGPGRELLRSSATGGGLAAAAHLFLPSFFQLALLFSLYAGLSWTAVQISKEARARPLIRLSLLAAAVPFISIVCLFGAALDFKFPFWGRHLAPTLPFILMAIGCVAASLASIWPTRKTAFLLVPFFAVLFFSSLELRFDVRHSKDDYRTAAALARDAIAHGKQVCWVAAPIPADFYHLPLSKTWPPTAGTASLVIPTYAPGNEPDMMIVSKPDLFDRNGLRRPWINLPGVKEKALCPSFVLYQFPPGGGMSAP